MKTTRIIFISIVVLLFLAVLVSAIPTGYDPSTKKIAPKSYSGIIKKSQGNFGRAITGMQVAGSQLFCVDNDGGQNIYSPSSAVLYRNGTLTNATNTSNVTNTTTTGLVLVATGTDRCYLYNAYVSSCTPTSSPGPCSVEEYYCNTPSSFTFVSPRTVCPNGCSNGACLQAPVCTPSTEVCNGRDDDCDTQIDENLGSSTCGTGPCARTVSNCVNGQPQTCIPGTPGVETCNGADDNCNGQIDDGLGSTSCGVGACARTTANCLNGQSQTCTPGSPTIEICGNGVDEDCNGQDLACCVPQIETCNGADDNCDGQTDENLGTSTCGTGPCTRTVPNCVNGQPQTCVPGTPASRDSCNGIDDDCDSSLDEDCIPCRSSCNSAKTICLDTTCPINKIYRSRYEKIMCRYPCDTSYTNCWNNC